MFAMRTYIHLFFILLIIIVSTYIIKKYSNNPDVKFVFFLAFILIFAIIINLFINYNSSRNIPVRNTQFSNILVLNNLLKNKL